MTFLKAISAAMLALALCAGVRADDGCNTCGEKKPKCAECDKCSPCETAKRCASPVRNFFVRKVGGTISGTIAHGFGLDKCNTCSTCAEVKTDCGCGK